MNKVAFSRELRRQSTPAECILWQALRNRQLQNRKFRRQHPIGRFIVDFYCATEKLVIELDGNRHANIGSEMYDSDRDLWLSQLGLKVIRIENREIYKHLERVLWEIKDAFQPHPNPLL